MYKSHHRSRCRIHPVKKCRGRRAAATSGLSPVLLGDDVQDSSSDSLGTRGLEAWVYCAALITPALNSARTDLTNSSSPDINTKRQRVDSSQASNVTRTVRGSAGWPVCSETPKGRDSPWRSWPQQALLGHRSRLGRRAEPWGLDSCRWPSHQRCRPSLPAGPWSYSPSLSLSFLFSNMGIILIVVEESGRWNDLIFAKSYKTSTCLTVHTIQCLLNTIIKCLFQLPSIGIFLLS